MDPPGRRSDEIRRPAGHHPDRSPHPARPPVRLPGVNYLIQSLAADLFKGALIQLDDEGFGDHLLLPVHDEVIAQAPTDEAEAFAADLAHTMSGTLGPVPITAEGEVLGRSWGAKYQEAIHAH